jgi:hypothetical protein
MPQIRKDTLVLVQVKRQGALCDTNIPVAFINLHFCNFQQTIRTSIIKFSGAARTIEMRPSLSCVGATTIQMAQRKHGGYFDNFSCFSVTTQLA